MKDLVHELLKLNAAAQAAADIAKANRDAELFYALRDIGWKSTDLLAKVCQTPSIVTAPELLS